VGAPAQEAVVNAWLHRILMLPPQASTVAKQVDYLHYAVILTTMCGAAGVGLLALYYTVRYRAGTGRGGYRAPASGAFHTTGGKSVFFELGTFGGLLGLFVVFWVIGFVQYVRVAEPPPGAMTIYVIGKQWMWDFAYPDGSGSVGVLYVPAGRPIQLVMTSRDVIQSFYVPAFRNKRDVIPGRSTTLWFQADEPGRHRIECAEYCGAGHSTMRGEVVVLSAEDYARRLSDFQAVRIAGPAPGDPAVVGEESPSPPLSLAAVGRSVAADAGCLRCHTVDGTPHIGPTWAGLYGATIPLQGGARVIADGQYLTKSMMDPAADIHLGFPNVMPSYQGLLTAPQIGAIVEYIRSLRDVSRHAGGQPLPAPVSPPAPIVTPLPGDTPRALPADSLQRQAPPGIPIYPPPSEPPPFEPSNDQLSR
jgi:cytochrome c oxidase subunit 2